MNAVLYLDLEHMFPVIDGVRHRSVFLAVPAPGTPVQMLCGVTAAAQYDDAANRNARGVQTLCLRCDDAYRRKVGIPSRASRQQR